ncbi:sulfate transporter CysZ [Halochromatium roseum]|uniref:sulfate transporter CysZ n=1 Tax=Halochromatium roseum TaxID=391920 RepID=UPI0019144750|nr:sulfate transporter CysZ [Halochromatium roseum]MBK5940276.1 sulfate transporter CysZ [Halochromatium roseum]
MPSNPIRGAVFMLEGLRLILRPGLRRFVVIPLLVNIGVFGAAIWYGIHRFEAALGWMEQQLPSWLHWLDWLLWPVFMLALLIIVFYSFTLVANLIASPFNGVLAEKAEAMLTERSLNEPIDYAKLIKELPIILWDEMKKILYALIWTIPFLILALVVPVIGPLIWFLFTAWMLAVQYSDFPMGNHGLLFREQRARLRQRRVIALGFGSAAAALTMIPVLNFVVMPAAVAGATAMWVRAFKDDNGS